MKILLYFENEKMIKKSGIGRALRHQIEACKLQGLEYTTNPKDSFDVAHINTYYRRSYHLAKKLRKHNVPCIVHGHSTKEDFRKSFRLWQLIQYTINHKLKKIYSIPDLIITPTNYSKKLIENYPFVHCPVRAISNGIDLKNYAQGELTDDERLALRKQFGILPNQKVVIGIGWYFERKGIHDFIEVARKLPDVRFIWFGQRMRLLIPHKINKAVRHKPDNVLLPGYVDSKVIAKMLHLCDCFFFPSYEETEGIVLLEALACKAPVLIRDIGAFDYLTDGKDCFKAKDNASFVEKLNYIFNNDMSLITENGYAIVQKRDIHIVSEELKQCYTEIYNMKNNTK